MCILVWIWLIPSSSLQMKLVKKKMLSTLLTYFRKKPSPVIASNSGPSGWREVVQKRIESNTRRFAHGRTKPEPVATLNKFTQVAGQFFYPLMAKADKAQAYLDLLGSDSILLFRLLYTLAIILHSAINLPVSWSIVHVKFWKVFIFLIYRLLNTFNIILL